MSNLVFSYFYIMNTFHYVHLHVYICSFVFFSRPDTAFLWFLNPMKSVKYLFCKRFKWLFIKITALVLVAALLILFMYSIPGYTAKRLVGA